MEIWRNTMKMSSCTKHLCNMRYDVLQYIFTTRKWSCGKVMFLHLSVSHSVHRGEGVSCHFLLWIAPPPGSPPRMAPPRQHPLPTVNKRAVGIILECCHVKDMLAQLLSDFSFWINPFFHKMSQPHKIVLVCLLTHLLKSKLDQTTMLFVVVTLSMGRAPGLYSFKDWNFKFCG